MLDVIGGAGKTALAFSILGFIFSLIMLVTTLCMGLGIASDQRSLLGMVSAVLAFLCFLWGLIAWAVWLGQYRAGLAGIELSRNTLKPSWAWAFVFLASILSLINAPICMLKGSE